MAIFAILIIGLLCFDAAAAGGCGRWVVRDNTDFLQDPIMDMNYDPIPNATPSAAAASGDAKADAIPPETAISAPEIDLSGSWSVKLNGTTNASIDMILIQSTGWSDDGAVRMQGYGSIYEGTKATQLTATGSLSNNTLTIDLKPSGKGSPDSPNRKYILKLEMAETKLSGSYEMYSSDLLAEKGSATAERSGE